MDRRFTPRAIALLVLAVAAVTIAGALASQVVFGLVPCKLCLLQRWPYYVGLPIAAATAAAPRGSRAQWGGLGVLAVVFAVSAGLGGYHAGVEWGAFLGPSDCGGGAGPPPAGVGDFLQGLDRVRVVSCTEAAWRFLGLSLAGWNAVISAALAILCTAGAVRPARTA